VSGPFGPYAAERADPGRVAARALSFGADADGYDEARPSYPIALVDDLLGEGATAVLDVGCGTGKAARLFLARGARVLGVEADERMAAVARRHGVSVEIARFEDWEPHGRQFSLLTAGQSWHWVDPERGPRKAAEVLEPGGRLALFWNLRERPVEEVARALEALYSQHAPELAGAAMAIGAPIEARGLESHLDVVASTERFEDCEVRHYRWTHRYDPASWRALLASQSDHHLLPDDRRQRLLDAAAEVIEAFGGLLEVSYVTLALLARRRAARAPRR
jgi:SAM-dependent methyltransferase